MNKDFSEHIVLQLQGSVLFGPNFHYLAIKSLLSLKLALLILVSAFLVHFAPVAKAETSTLPSVSTSSQGITRQQGDAILQELRSIRKLLQQQQAQRKGKVRKRPTSAKIKLGEHAALGKDDAPVSMIEFTDYQCPYCKRFHDTTFPTLKEKYIDTGKLRYIAMDLPLSFHKQARIAANAALCANEQNRFWQMRTAMFKNPRKLMKEDLLGYAKELSMDVDAFAQCMAQNRYAKRIQKDINVANAAGFTGTPSFVVGKNVNGVVNGAALIGAKPLADFENQINRLLPKLSAAAD